VDPEDAECVRADAETWAETFLQDTDRETQAERIQDFIEIQQRLSGLRVSPRPHYSEALRHDVFESMLEVYGTVYQHQGSADAELLKQHKREALSNALTTRDASQALYLDGIFRAAAREDPVLGRQFYWIAESYGGNHPLDSTSTDALIANVLPRMRKGDPQVRVLQEEKNVFGMGRGDFGLGDFVCHSYTSEVAPANLNELLMALREIPTSNYARLEQNRLDGRRLAATFGGLRDFIHDERPGVHDVISGMVSHYDTGDPTALKHALDRTEQGQLKYLAADRGRILDLRNYGKSIDDSFLEEQARGIEDVITILRRLQGNTVVVDEAPPSVSDVNLHAMLEHVAEADGYSKKQAVNRLTKYVNGKIEGMIAGGVVGVDPSFVEALAWTERKQYGILQHMSYEDQVGLAKQGWFREVLRFHELTHASNYDGKEFNAFMRSLDGLNDIAAARAIATRTMLQVRDLADRYNAEGKQEWVDAIWSGNVTHELIGLLNRKPAVTAIGRRLLAEEVRIVENGG
jgi:hypothetical protein